MTMETALRTSSPAAGGTPAALAPARAPAVRAPQPGSGGGDGAARPARAAAPLGRGLSGWDNQLQGAVARAQQALDYLGRVASQLESVKGELAARLSGARGDARQLEARVRELGATLAARAQRAGGGVDARLGFDGQPASRRFRIQGVDIDALQSGAPQSLTFSIGGAGGAQLTVDIEPGLSRQEIAQRLDRALAPARVHAGLDGRGRLVFSAAEADWAGNRDSIAISGRGRVATEEADEGVDPQGWDTGNADALRQSLREVVQALARVRRSQDAAQAALGDATARAAQAQAQARAADAAKMAQDFASTASSPDYDSLLAVTSALVGVSRERVLALLGLR